MSKFATGKVTVWEFVTGGREDFMLNGWYPDTVRQAVREGRDARGKVIQSDASPPDARHRQTFVRRRTAAHARALGWLAWSLGQHEVVLVGHNPFPPVSGPR